MWKNYLNTNFEGSYYPGAAGRVGYEKYMGLGKDDCYDLLFGNMGPEVLNWVFKKPTFDLDDYFYFARIDSDPGNMFVSRESKLQTIDDIVAEGKKRKLVYTGNSLSIDQAKPRKKAARKTTAKSTK